MLMAQVVVRFAFGHGLTFSEELCRFSFLYLVYFAASLVACKGAHIRVTAHTQKLPAPVRVGPVSYTHLDVYKRQSKRSMKG